MELKAELKAPYTPKERMMFVIEQNHKLGYRIKKTETSLQAWGLEENEIIEKKKQQVRAIRNNYLEIYIDSKIKNPFMWDDLTEEEKTILGNYRKYLLNYTKEEIWWEQNPKTFDEWKESL